MVSQTYDSIQCLFLPPPLIRPDSHQVFSQANTPLKKWLLDFAYSRKEAELKNGLVRQDSIWDKLIFRKVQVSKACCRNVASASQHLHPSHLPVSESSSQAAVVCLQESLGGRVRMMITGAAPVSPTILTFLRAALGCQVGHTLRRSATSCFCCHGQVL